MERVSQAVKDPKRNGGSTLNDDQQEAQGDGTAIANGVVSAEPNDVQSVGANLTPAPAPSQMSNHGLFPTSPVLEKRTYSSTMSYVGMTRRTTAWVRKTGSSSAVAATVAWSAASLFLLLMYVVLVAWYLVVFVLFGFFTFPFRIIRRGQRKREHLQQTQLATMQTMLVQQQQAMLRNQPPSDPPQS